LENQLKFVNICPGDFFSNIGTIKGSFFPEFIIYCSNAAVIYLKRFDFGQNPPMHYKIVKLTKTKIETNHFLI
jgi:hypothetical protein